MSINKCNASPSKQRQHTSIALTQLLKQFTPITPTTIALLLSTTLLISCISQTPIPQDRFYHLPEIKSTKRQPVPMADTIAVKPIKMQGIYNERNLFYVDADKPFELQRYHYRYWTNSPNYLLQDNLVSYLRNTDIANNVYPTQINHQADQVVSGRVLRFDRVMQGAYSKIVVNMELQLSSENKHSKPLVSKLYSSSVTITDSDFSNVVEAYSRALNLIYDEFIADIDKSSQH